MKIITKRLLIRVVKGEDVTDEYVSGLNDPEVNKYLFVRHAKQTVESVMKFVDQNYKSDGSILLGLFLNDRLIGTVRLSEISYFDYCLNLGICIFDKTQWNKGLGEEALIRIKKYIFSDMGMHYIEAGIYDENEFSKRVFEKAGFRLREEVGNKYRLRDIFVRVLIYKAVNNEFDLKERLSQPRGEKL